MTSIPTDRRSRRWSRAVAAPLGAVVLVGLAACGTGTSTDPAAGTGASTSGTASAQPGAPSDTAVAAYVSCLQQNGVTLPERPDGGTPPQGAGGTPPSGAPAPPADGARGGGPGGPGAAGQAPPGVDADAWAAAQEACADLVPAAGSGT
jgi:hypothetical protein